MNLINSSLIRSDGKSSSLEGLNCVQVHTNCRKSYTRPDTIKAFLSQKESLKFSQPPTPPKEKLRSSNLFDFKDKCIFCLEAIDDAFHLKEKKTC